MSPEKVHLTEEKATLLATLYGRALDARSPRPILGDRMAAETLDRIEHGFGRMGMTPGSAAAVALRARFLDRWAAGFLDAHPKATVLHLGCGLDTRVHRLDPPDSVRWYDVDYPEVVELRRRLFPERRAYATVGTSVTDLAWLERVPADAPALVVAEGLLYYLDPDGGRALLRAIVERFPSGLFVFDALSSFGLRLQRLNRPVRTAAHSGMPVASSRYTSSTVPILFPLRSNALRPIRLRGSMSVCTVPPTGRNCSTPLRKCTSGMSAT